MSRVFTDCPLKNYTTFRIGGICKKLTEVYTEADMTEAYREDALVIGKGSNILFADSYLDREVIVNGIGGFELNGDTFTVGSGMCLNGVIARLMEHGRGGLEWAVNIPGTVGGAVRMNAGAFGSSISDSLLSVKALVKGKAVTLPASALGLKYRKSELGQGDVILSATFLCAQRGEAESKAMLEDFKQRRRDTQPTGFSAGSVFLKADKPAGYYIDQAGLKGRAVGGAYVSQKHANFILNNGFATALDVRTLMKVIQAVVYDTFHVKLKEEIRLIGDF